jgi:hypothetical protein
VPDTSLISAQISDLKSQFVAHEEHLSRLQEDLTLKQQLLKQQIDRNKPIDVVQLQQQILNQVQDFID